MTNGQRHWFPAKRYGWGWGLPIAWQGWVVLAVYFGLLLIGAHVLQPHVATVVLTGALAIVSWLKGERPHWRWGGK